MSLIKKLKKKIHMLTKETLSPEQLYEKIGQLKNQFSNKDFQWFKPLNLKDMGKIITCTDITELRGNIMMIFNDQSKLNYDLLNDHLVIVQDRNNPPLAVGEFAAHDVNTAPPNESKPMTLKESLRGTGNANTQSNESKKQEHKVEVKEQQSVFDMFPENEFNLNITIKSKLPDMNLLKMMYASSLEKDKFLESIINKIMKSINDDSIKNSIKKHLEDGN